MTSGSSERPLGDDRPSGPSRHPSVDALLALYRQRLASPPFRHGIGELARLFDIEVGDARLIFRTPLRLRAGRGETLTASSLLFAVRNRVAPWHYSRLEVDWLSIHAAAHRVSASTHEMIPSAWNRGSIRSGRVPVLAAIGTVTLRGNLTPFADFMRLGELVNGGSQAALAFGRYQLSLLR